MNWDRAIPRVFDRYDLAARIAPGLLAIGIPIMVLSQAYPEQMPTGGTKWLSMSAFVVGSFMVIASWTRSRGKAIEVRLLQVWGGFPTEILLRHRDETIEPLTKRRFHAALQTMTPDVVLPNADTELVDPISADAAYRSVVRRLIEQRRSEQSKLILIDNASYGFWRNIRGMRAISICLTALALALVIVPDVAQILISLGTATHNVWPVPARTGIAIFIGLAWLGYLILVVTDEQVWRAAVSYAERLLGSLDQTHVAIRTLSTRTAAMTDNAMKMPRNSISR